MVSSRTADEVELTVITVYQPYASLLISGEKWCENRPKPYKYRGPLWIHAGLDDDEEECTDLKLDSNHLPHGELLGCVDLVDTMDVDDFSEIVDEVSDQYGLDKKHQWRFISGLECWIVTNPRRLREPIPIRGKQGIWKHHISASQISDLLDPTPLIEHVPPTPCPVQSQMIEVAGKREKVRFHLQGNSRVSMNFAKRQKSRYANAKHSSHYKEAALSDN